MAGSSDFFIAELSKGLSKPSNNFMQFAEFLAARGSSYAKSKLPLAAQQTIGVLESAIRGQGAGMGEGQGNLPPQAPSSLQGALSRRDPILSVDWIAIVVDRANPKAIDWYYIDALQTPSLNFEPQTVFRNGKMQHYAGPVSVNNLDITLYTDASGASMKFASSWFNSVFDNNSGNYRLPKDYKKDVYVYLYDAARQTLCEFKFFGCFPTSWGSYSLESASASPIPTTLELTVDFFSIGSDSALVQSEVQKFAAAESTNFGFPTKPTDSVTLSSISSTVSRVFPGLPKFP